MIRARRARTPFEKLAGTRTSSPETKAIVPRDRASIDLQLTDFEPTGVRQEIAQVAQKRTTLRSDQWADAVARQEARDLCGNNRLQAGPDLFGFREVDDLHGSKICKPF